MEKSPSLHVTLFMVHITDLRLSLSGKRLQNTTVQCNIRLAECVPSRNGQKLRFREKKKDTAIGVHLRTMPTGKSTSIKRELSVVESFSFLIKQAILQEEKKRKKKTETKQHFSQFLNYTSVKHEETRRAHNFQWPGEGRMGTIGIMIRRERRERGFLTRVGIGLWEVGAESTAGTLLGSDCNLLNPMEVPTLCHSWHRHPPICGMTNIEDMESVCDHRKRYSAGSMLSGAAIFRSIPTCTDSEVTPKPWRMDSLAKSTAVPWFVHPTCRVEWEWITAPWDSNRGIADQLRPSRYACKHPSPFCVIAVPNTNM